MNRQLLLLNTFLCLLILGGCAATLEDFQQMSAGERTDYVCERLREVKYLTTQVNENYDAITDTEAALARGYRIHQSCKEISITRPDVKKCYVVNDKLQCVEKTEREYETVCEDIPVAIDGDLEQKKLRRYESAYDEHSARLDRALRKCRRYVNGLSADAAFDYYQSAR